ncbi:MAG: hypothetical protein OEX02_17750 [Cyclobacteriaceae bacterium]|nr:hypothetical protein [Cyclobacteriaceae bacterium]
MIEDELITIWQSSPREEQVKFEKSRLMIEVETSLDRFHKAIKYGIVIEAIAVLIASPVFIYYIFIVPHILSKVASALIAIWGIFIIIHLKRAKRNKPDLFSESYLLYLHKTREYLYKQKRLRDTALYWYILPANAFVFLFLAGFIGIPEKTTYLIGMVIICTLLGIKTYYYNKRVVKKKIIPRLEKVEELIKVMESKE